MATVADYVDRKIDLLAFQGDFPTSREQLLTQALTRSSEGGMITAGIQKLAQRFLLALLTQRNSQRHRPQEGTTFLIEAAKGLWRTVADVEQSFYAAVLDVKRMLRAVELESDPPDEIFAEAILTGVSLFGDQVTVRVLLTSAAGDNVTFLTPIAVTIR